jgi:lipopolysaccharide/colanic/teichoic acid biosynthesis glycosyltransferase
MNRTDHQERRLSTLGSGRSGKSESQGQARPLAGGGLGREPRTGSLEQECGNASAYERAKRVVDVVVALVSLAALSPILLLIAALVKLTSRGPVFYRGTVIGRHGRPFTYYKFRTMRVDGDDSVHRQFIARYMSGEPDVAREAEGSDPREAGRRPVATCKLVDDPRITPVGRLVRRTSLDEMAQMLNVLRGEMSVVGPRPPVPYEYEQYTPEQQHRLAVLPGITGLAQVRARGRATFEEMVAMDFEYIRRRSLRLDLSIMARTVWVVLSARGAR